MARIRAFRWHRDREAVLGFQREIYEGNFAGLTVTGEFLENYGRSLREAAGEPNEGLFVLEAEGQVRGFLWVAVVSSLVNPWSGYLKNLYVAPELRGQGWGRALLAHADEWLRARGVARVELDCTVGNERAQHLYESCGYEATRLRMAKRLG